MSDTLSADNVFAWWRAALAGAPPELTPYKAEPGFYRHQTSEGWLPVAIWPEGGQLIARVGRAGKEQLADEVFCERVFSRCARNPVTEETYWTFVDGGMWPDAPPAIAKSNLPLSERDQLKLELEGERAEAERWLKATTIANQEQADRAINWSTRIAEIEKKAEAARKREKQPFLDEARAVDDEWKPIVSGADQLKRLLKGATTPFLVAQKREREEEERRQREAIATGAQPVEPIAPVRSGKAGTVGHVAGVRTVKTAKIVDFAATLQFFSQNEEIREVVQQLATRAIRAGVTVPGCEIETSNKVQ